MDRLQAAIMSNCYFGNMPGVGNFSMYENAGYVVFKWPGGSTTRMRKSADGVGCIVPTPNGDVYISESIF